LEHSSLSLAEVSALSYTATLTGITPLVRLPWQCGAGYVQQVLDGGAMGVIFPHIATKEDAYAAVQTCKFPPVGKRSMWAQQPVLGMQKATLPGIAEACNAKGSSVLVMIEAMGGVKNIDSIAGVDGVDMLLVGCLDLSTDMGIPGNFDAKDFQEALTDISQACRRHGKIMGLAGLYNNPSLQRWAINELGVRFILCQQDSNLIAVAARECAAGVELASNCAQ
jgi:2-keto-3-deoxy-L-rhamnonate aldolase RhmA